MRRRVLTGLEADPALCTVQEVILGPGVSPATNGPASQDRPLQTEEHRAGNQQTEQRGHHKTLKGGIIYFSCTLSKFQQGILFFGVTCLFLFGIQRKYLMFDVEQGPQSA